MKYSYSYLQMREADAAAMCKADALTLMERAGKALADVVERIMVRLRIGDVLFVCGGGNNGGDGFVAARLMMQRDKCAEVLCLAEKFSESCAAQKERFEGTVYGRMPRRRYALIVDCILGTGLSRAPRGMRRNSLSLSTAAADVSSARFAERPCGERDCLDSVRFCKRDGMYGTYEKQSDYGRRCGRCGQDYSCSDRNRSVRNRDDCYGRSGHCGAFPQKEKQCP